MNDHNLDELERGLRDYDRLKERIESLDNHVERLYEGYGRSLNRFSVQERRSNQAIDELRVGAAKIFELAFARAASAASLVAHEAKEYE